MDIPSKFKLFGETYKVKHLVKIDKDGSWGECDYIKNTIKIKKSLNNEQKEQAFMHEIIHLALHNLGYNKLNDDEVLVDTMAKALHQILTSNG